MLPMLLERVGHASRSLTDRPSSYGCLTYARLDPQLYYWDLEADTVADTELGFLVIEHEASVWH